MKSFVAFLAVAVTLAAATKVDTYETQEVEYHYQPQQGLHTVVASAEEHQHYRHTQPAASTHHHQHHEEVEEKKHYKHIPIVKSESSQGKDGSYKYEFETGNGIHQAEHGYVKNAGQKEHEIQVAEGYYSYTDEHGHQIGVHYIADENGFRAVGDHLPTPPPMPEALKEAYAKIAAHPELYPEEEEEKQPQYKQVEEQPEQSYEHVAYHHAAPVANHHHHPQVHAAAPVHHADYSGHAEYEH